MIQFLRLVLIVFLTSTVSARSRDPDSMKLQTIPLPTFKSITVNSLGEFYGIQAIGIEDYIKKYRQNAWRIGLDDNRLIGELNSDTGHSKTQPGEQDLRVKDLFLDQYYKSVEQKEFLGVRTASTWAERDLEIERIRSTIR
jgi:hypothetical protein